MTMEGVLNKANKLIWLSVILLLILVGFVSGWLNAAFFEGLIYAIIILFGCFLPALIAARRRHLNSSAITVLNLFLGWTVLGWIISLVWSMTANTK
jgi:uncharacterized membrane protein (DUF485 family)